MLIWNYEFLPPLEPLLALPPPSVAVALRTSAIIVVVDVIVHHMPILRLSLLASARRRAWRVVTPLALLATVDPEEVDVTSRLFQLHLSPLLCLPHRDKHDTVALHVPLFLFVFHPVLRQVIVFVDTGGSARALPP
jgi:hypothetical protein